MIQLLLRTINKTIIFVDREEKEKYGRDGAGFDAFTGYASKSTIKKIRLWNIDTELLCDSCSIMRCAAIYNNYIADQCCNDEQYLANEYSNGVIVDMGTIWSYLTAKDIAYMAGHITIMLLKQCGIDNEEMYCTLLSYIVDKMSRLKENTAKELKENAAEYNVIPRD